MRNRNFKKKKVGIFLSKEYLEIIKEKIFTMDELKKLQKESKERIKKIEKEKQNEIKDATNKEKN